MEKITYEFDLTAEQAQRLFNLMDGRSFEEFLKYVESLQEAD